MNKRVDRVKQLVSTLLHRARVRVREGVDRVRFWKQVEQTVEHPEFGNKGWQCPECQKWMHQGVKEDHQTSHEEKTGEEIENANTISGYEAERNLRGELVDDYDADWLENRDEEKGIEIQEATGSSNIKKQQLRKKWEPFLKQLRESGKVEVTSHQHHGGLRGAHIVQRMKQDLKRLDIEMELEYDIGESKSVVRVASVRQQKQ